MTEASDTAYASHVGEVGSTITLHPSYSANATVSGSLDRAYSVGTTAYYYSGVPPSANYEAQMEFFHVSTIAINVALCVRMSTTVDTMYLIRLNNGVDWTLRKIVAGAQTTLTTTTNNVPTVGNSKLVRLAVSGTSLTVYIDGVLESALSATDGDITAAGRVGVRQSGVGSSSTGYHWDNLSAR